MFRCIISSNKYICKIISIKRQHIHVPSQSAFHCPFSSSMGYPLWSDHLSCTCIIWVWYQDSLTLILIFLLTSYSLSFQSFASERGHLLQMHLYFLSSGTCLFTINGTCLFTIHHCINEILIHFRQGAEKSNSLIFFLNFNSYCIKIQDDFTVII